MGDEAPVVLIVEDDAGVRGLLQRELSDLRPPLQVLTSATAHDALDVLAREPVAVVLTDIRMPGMDGVELTRRIKAVDPAIEVILITGHATVQSAAEAVRLGAFDYLTKPFVDLTLLGQRVQDALQRRRERQVAAEQQRHLEAQHHSLARLTDALPMGVLLVDAAGRPGLSNRAAQALLSAGDALFLDEGVLSARDPSTHALLRTLLRHCAEAGRGDTLVVPRVRAGTPLSLLLSPLPEPERAGCATSACTVAVLIADSTRDLATADTVIAGLYGLTPAESRLAAELMQGKSLESASYGLGITTHTARTHLKHIFSKTRTTRQGELISLLLSGPAGLELGALDVDR